MISKDSLEWEFIEHSTCTRQVCFGIVVGEEKKLNQSKKVFSSHNTNQTKPINNTWFSSTHLIFFKDGLNTFCILLFF